MTTTDNIAALQAEVEQWKEKCKSLGEVVVAINQNSAARIAELEAEVDRLRAIMTLKQVNSTKRGTPGWAWKG